MSSMTKWPVLAAALLSLSPGARAHGGEDHGAAPPPPAATDGMRKASTSTSSVEVVVRWPAQDAGKEMPFRILLSDYATNSPIEGGTIDVTLSGPGGSEVATKASAASPGVYEAKLVPKQNGAHALSMTVSAGELVDIVALSGIEVGPPSENEVATLPHEHGIPWATIAALAVLVVVVLVVAGFVLRRRRRNVATLVASILALFAATARAHGGEDHSAGAATTSSAPAAGGAVFVAKESQFLLGIRTTLASMREVQERMRVPGVVTVPPERNAAIFAPQAGRLIPPAGGFPQLGAKVKKGQLLAVVEAVLSASERADFTAEEATARGEHQTGHARLEAAKLNLERMRALPGIVSKQELEAAEVEVRGAEAAAQAAAGRVAAFQTNSGASRFELRSPIEGVLADVGASPGEQLEQGTRAFLVVDAAVLTVEAKVNESDLGRLSAGMDAVVSVGAYEGRTFAGKLAAIGQVVDEATRTVKVVFAVDNPEGLLKLGMFADVEIGQGAPVRALSVPEAAVLDVEGRRVVYVHTAPEEFVAHEVALGRRDGGFYEVKQGLEEGDRVVVEGVYSLRNAPAAAR